VAVRVGYVVGPLIGGEIHAWRQSYAAPFWFVVGMLALTLAWTHLRFHETHPPDPKQRVRTLAAFTSLGAVFTDRDLRSLYLVNFLLYVAIFGFSRALIIYLVDRWQMGTREIGWFYAYFAVAVMVANLGLMPYLSARVDMKRLAILTAALGGLATLLVAVPASRIWLWATIGPSSCLLSLCLSATAALLANSVPAEKEGQVMGNNEALQDAAEAAGSAAAGSLGAISAGLPLVVYGGLVMVGAGFLARFRSPAPQPRTG